MDVLQMTGAGARAFWLRSLVKIADPVLRALSAGKLREELPLPFHRDRGAFAPLEAFGRLACGMAPWLACEGLAGPEEELRREYAGLLLTGLDMATDPQSPDYMDWGATGDQPLVDAAFLSHAVVRAPKLLAQGLSLRVRENFICALRATRRIVPHGSNWICFSAMVEAALFLLGDEGYDRMRVDYAVQMFDTWYKGDGVYGDGARFHWDYYNSYVIQPMLADLVTLFSGKFSNLRELCPEILRRAGRYAGVLERLIAPDGTYPVLGRSSCYRFGAFQLLSQAALEGFLPPELTGAQVRCALTAVLSRVLEAPGTFDGGGWLRPGVYGHQPGLAEEYINTGSLYLCAAVFLPLGLPPQSPFWSDPGEKWTSLKVWSGEDLLADHAID